MRKNNSETIKFKNFMDGSYKYQKASNPNQLYSISPFVMLDPVMLVIGGVIMLEVGLEKFFESRGSYETAENMNYIARLVIPTIAFICIIYFMTHNPLLRWLL